MWFLFGFITLISFSIYFGIERHKANWKGNISTAHGVPFQYYFHIYKNHYYYVCIGCDTAQGVCFSIKKEKWWDRLFKWLGISVEHQVDVDDFDKQFYLITDDRDICAIISRSPRLQNKIKNVVASCERHGLRLKNLHCRHGRLWLHLVPTNKSQRPNIFNIAPDVVPTLSAISDILKTSLLNQPYKSRDPFVLRAIVILAISTGLAVNGMAHLFRIVVIDIPFIVDDWPLFEQALPWGLFISVVLIISALIFLGRTARAHLVLIELLLAGTFGAISSTYIFMRDANIELDVSEPEYYTVEIYNKRISRGRRNTNYYFKVDDWNNQRGRIEISVTGKIYYRFSKNQKVKIVQMPGHLGYRWVADIIDSA